MIPLGVLGASGRRGAAVVSSKWDPMAKGPDITLSNGGLDAEKATTGWNSALGTIGKSGGKYAFEVVFLAGGSVNRPFAALADKTNLATIVGTFVGNTGAVNESIGYWGNGRVYFNLSPDAPDAILGLAATAVSDVITVAMDLVALEVKFYRNGAIIHTHSLPAGKTWFPACSVQGGGKARLRPSGLAYLPSGFSEWG